MPRQWRFLCTLLYGSPLIFFFGDSKNIAHPGPGANTKRAIIYASLELTYRAIDLRYGI
jgi:hypothetical protein